MPSGWRATAPGRSPASIHERTGSHGGSRWRRSVLGRGGRRGAVGRELQGEHARPGRPAYLPHAQRARRRRSVRRPRRVRPCVGDGVGGRNSRRGRSADARGPAPDPGRAAPDGACRASRGCLGRLRPGGNRDRPGRSGDGSGGAVRGRHYEARLVRRRHGRLLDSGRRLRSTPRRPTHGGGAQRLHVGRTLGQGALAPDGTLWVPDKETSVVFRVDPVGGRVIDSFFAGPGAYLVLRAFGSMWVLSYAGSDVRRYG